MLTDQKKTHRMSVRHCPYNMKLFLTSVSAQIFYFVLIFFFFFVGRGGGCAEQHVGSWFLHQQSMES